MKVRTIALAVGGLLTASLLVVPASTGAQASPAPSSSAVSSVSSTVTAVAADRDGKKVGNERKNSANRQRKPWSKRWHPANKRAFFNNPYAAKKPAARFAIQNYLIKAIRNTPKGETIRISVYSFDRNEVADALINARKRGVRVQILMNNHQVTRAQRRLYRKIGRNPKQRNFAYECKASCRASRDNLHSKFFLFTKTGGIKNVVMMGSVNFTLNAVKWQWNDLLSLTRQDKLHDDLREVFDDMRKDYSTDQPFRTYCVGTKDGCGPTASNQFLRVFPRKATPRNDAALAILNPIDCKYRSGGKMRRTVVRMSMHAMRGPRGDYLAEAWRNLWARGCDVRVIYGLMGAKTKRKLGAATARGRVPLRSAGFDYDGDGQVNRYTHQKYVLIGGMYGGRIGKTIFTGSSNWSSRGTSGDEIIYSFRGPGVFAQYMDNFRFMWNKHTRNAYTTTSAAYRTTESYRRADGTYGQRVVVKTRQVELNLPDGLGTDGPTWEDD
ncbi:hypothetical protein GCM10023340_27260 [Nocardioides marinquilinus]|uniref:phospholipase D n=1 Tax=Nocardioides marinquilinus TaxID=1210400 RepID=A0ABP9PQA2_9ACTN